jgi:peroxiredoxin
VLSRIIMKSVLKLLLLAIIPQLAIAKPTAGFVIKGTIEGLASGTVSVAYANLQGNDTTINAPIVAGKFTLTGQVPEPELAQFTVTAGWQYGTKFFIENTVISFNLIKDSPEKTSITGSSSNLIYERLEPQQRAFFEQARSYDATQKQAKSTHNKALQKSYDSTWAVQEHQWFETIHASITANNRNYAALYFIRWLLFHPDNFTTIMALFNRLDATVRNGPAGKDFTAAFDKAYKTAIGQPAPEIVGKDTSGKTVTLASLKGKVVLLDFWASYCASCRQQNPRLKAVYDKYHPSGFDIVSLSLDNARSQWVSAIEHDKLNWPQASELRGGAGASAGVYDVTDLPRNFLIDRAGKIIGKDLFGEDLIEKLQQAVADKGK